MTTAKGKAPAGALRLAVELLAEGSVGLPAPEDLAFYLGYDEVDTEDAERILAEFVRKAPEARLPSVALEVVAPGAEDNMAACDQSWGYSPALALRWLGFLAGIGHELTETETQLIDEARRRLNDENETADG